MRTRALRLILAAALACLAIGGVAASASAERTFFPSHCSNAKFKPKSIIVACGDAGLIVDGITYSHYGSKRAAGSGNSHTNTCMPDCASGTRVDRPATITLFRARRCKDNGKRQFTRLHFNYVGGPPPGVTADDFTLPFPCGGIV